MNLDIEREINSIHNSEIRNLFFETYKLYTIQNYRACIVMLWSCIVCDFFLKLEESIALYNDGKSKSILEEINKIRAGKTFQVDWENKLLERIGETCFFTDIEVAQINEIHQHRHWCAHPSFKDNYELYSPDQDLCRSHLETALSLVLLRQPFFSKRIIDSVLDSLSEYRQYGYDYETITRFLDEKYISKISDDLKRRLFKDLWKITFNCQSVEAKINRKVNMFALCHLLKTSDYLMDEISNNKDYYSNIIFLNTEEEGKINNEIAEPFFILIFLFSSVYNKLTMECQEKINSLSNSFASYLILSTYKHDSFFSHLQELQKISFQSMKIGLFNSFFNIPMHILDLIHRLAIEKGCEDEFYKFLIMLHAHSPSFDFADKSFEYLQEYLSSFSSESILLLLTEIDSNDQCYNRNRKSRDMIKIKTVISRNNYQIDMSQFSHI